MTTSQKIINFVFIVIIVGLAIFLVRSKRSPINQTPANIPSIVNNSDNGGLDQTYQNSRLGFSLRYPAGYTVDSYTYQNPGSGKDIEGVKFIIPPSLAGGTNLASDSLA